MSLFGSPSNRSPFVVNFLFQKKIKLFFCTMEFMIRRCGMWPLVMRNATVCVLFFYSRPVEENNILARCKLFRCDALGLEARIHFVPNHSRLHVIFFSKKIPFFFFFSWALFLFCIGDDTPANPYRKIYYRFFFFLVLFSVSFRDHVYCAGMYSRIE